MDNFGVAREILDSMPQNTELVWKALSVHHRVLFGIEHGVRKPGDVNLQPGLPDGFDKNLGPKIRHKKSFDSAKVRARRSPTSRKH